MEYKTTPYQRGRYRERMIKKKLQKQGKIVLRSAASRGFADLVSIDKELKKIKFIQVKPKTFPSSKSKKLMEEFNWLNQMFQVEFIVAG